MTLPVGKVAQYHAPIYPIAEGTPRPFWSVMIPAFERTEFLAKTIESVLAQDPGPEQMQIEVIDNCSKSPNVAKLVNDLGKGRVAIFRQPKNVGMCNNWNTCIERARGKWVHILHDDDYVQPGFYQKLREADEKNSEIGAAFCRYETVDEAGKSTYTSPAERASAGVLENWLERIAQHQWISTPSIAVKRSTYETLGGFETIVPCPSDWEMWVRIAAYFPVWYEPTMLASYRLHSLSTTSEITRSGASTAQMRMAILLANMYLPDNRARYLQKRCLDSYARNAFILARRYLAEGDGKAARAQIREGLRCSKSIRSMAFLGRLLAGASFKRLIGKR